MAEHRRIIATETGSNLHVIGDVKKTAGVAVGVYSIPASAIGHPWTVPDTSPAEDASSSTSSTLVIASIHLPVFVFLASPTTFL